MAEDGKLDPIAQAMKDALEADLNKGDGDGQDGGDAGDAGDAGDGKGGDGEDGAGDGDGKDKDGEDNSSGDGDSGGDNGEDGASPSGNITIPKVDGDGQDGVVDFDKLLADKSSGKYKTLADIDKALEEAPQDAFANEQIAKLNEYVKQGGKLNDFARTQTVDYGKMDDLDAIKEGMRVSDPNLTSEDIDLLVEDEYGVSDKATDREKRLSMIRQKQDGEKSRKALLEYQEKWRVAMPSDADKEANRGAQVEAWQKSLNTKVDDIEEVEFKINENDSFKFKLSDEVRSSIKKNHGDLSKFFDKYLNEDGSENIGKFIKDMAILDNYEAIMRSASAYSRGQGREEVLKEMKNPDFQKRQAEQRPDPNQSIKKQAFQHFKKHN